MGRVVRTKLIGRLLQDMDILPTSNATYVPDLSQTFVGTTLQSRPSLRGGFVGPLVAVGDMIVANQTLAYVYNAYEDVLQTLRSPVAGRIHTVATDPATEPGRGIVDLIYNSTDVECADGCVL